MNETNGMSEEIRRAAAERTAGLQRQHEADAAARARREAVRRKKVELQSPAVSRIQQLASEAALAYPTVGIQPNFKVFVPKVKSPQKPSFRGWLAEFVRTDPGRDDTWTSRDAWVIIKKIDIIHGSFDSDDHSMGGGASSYTDYVSTGAALLSTGELVHFTSNSASSPGGNTHYYCDDPPDSSFLAPLENIDLDIADPEQQPDVISWRDRLRNYDGVPRQS
jgi:hypothetical protein